MNIQPMVMTYTSALFNYRNTVNQRYPNANNTKTTCRKIQNLAGHGGKGRGGIRGCGRGKRGGRGRGSRNPNARRNDEWQVKGINRKMIKAHPLHCFEQYQRFNIPEDICNQLNHMRREYQAKKCQHTNNYNGNTGYNGSNNGSGNQFGSYQDQISQDKSVPYGGSMIYPMPPQTGNHMIPPPPPPPPPQYIPVNKVNKFQQQQQHDYNANQIIAVVVGID